MDAAVGIVARAEITRCRPGCVLPAPAGCRRARSRRARPPKAARRRRNGRRETRSASIRSFGDTSRMTASMVRRPSGFGVTVAVSDHSPSAPVELTASAMPPSQRARQTEIDVLEGPALAVALIVDNQRAVLQPDLGERAAVEAERVELVDPGEHGGVADRSATSTGGRRAGSSAFGAAIAAERDRAGDRGRDCERRLARAGQDVDLAAGLDAQRHLGADQAQALGLHLAGEQAERRKPDLGLRRARDHGAVRVAHHDVAQAQRRAADSRRAPARCRRPRRDAGRRAAPRSPR